MRLSLRAAASLAAASLFAFAPGCSSILGDFATGPSEEGGTADGSMSESGTDSSGTSEGGGDTGSSSSGGDSGTVNHDSGTIEGGGTDGGTDGSADGGPTDSGSGGDGSDGGCSPTQQLCNGGCVPLDDPAHCGSCSLDCNTLPNTTTGATCSGGVCSVTCAVNFGNCSGASNVGCPDSLTTAKNCGACNNACAASAPVCSQSGGTYACGTGCGGATPNFCPATQMCVNFQTDPSNCNGCGIVCGTVPRGTPTCSGGICGIACQGTQTNCGSATGCVDETSDPNACGSCTNVCPTPTNGTATCANSQCGFTCTSPYQACGSGCADIQTDTNNCGLCGHVCPGATNGLPTCTNAQCGISCNGATPTYCSASNACVDTQTDAANCGTCGHSCHGGTCTGGACQPLQLWSGNAVGIATDGSRVYFSTGPAQTVLWVPVDTPNGSPTTELLLTGTGKYTSSVFYDPSSSEVFVIETNNGVVYGINSNYQIVFQTAATFPQSDGIAATASTVYWGYGNKIESAPKSNGSAAQVNNTLPGAAFISSLVIDPNTNLLVAGSLDSTGIIAACPLAVGATCVTTSDYPNVTGVTVAGGHVYAVNRGTSPNYTDNGLFTWTLGSSPPSLSNWQTVAAGNDTYGTLNANVTSDGTYVYWPGNSGSVYRNTVGSPGGSAIGTWSGNAYAIANSSTAVFWATSSGVYEVAK